MFTTEGLYDQKIKCPLCSTEYSTKKVLSRAAKVKGVDGDFRAHYSGLNPSYYAVNVCQECGFAFMEKTKPKISSSQRSRYIADVISRWRPRTLTEGRSIHEGIVAFKLAIFCAQHIEEPARTVGGLCLQLAWLYRELEDQEQEMRFLRDALDFYRYAYETDDTIELDGRLTYLLGELYRRVGDERSAVFFFNKLIHDKKALPKYVRLARQQWELLREPHMQAVAQ